MYGAVYDRHDAVSDQYVEVCYDCYLYDTVCDWGRHINIDKCCPPSNGTSPLWVVFKQSHTRTEPMLLINNENSSVIKLLYTDLVLENVQTPR